MRLNDFVVLSDDNGWFRFSHIPPGTLFAGKWREFRLSPVQQVHFDPGSQREIRFRKAGWTVSGRAVTADEELDWRGGPHLAVIRPAGDPTRPDDEELVAGAAVIQPSSSADFPLFLDVAGRFSIPDIKIHLKHIFAKTGRHGRLEAVSEIWPTV